MTDEKFHAELCGYPWDNSLLAEVERLRERLIELHRAGGSTNEAAEDQ